MSQIKYFPRHTLIILEDSNSNKKVIFMNEDMLSNTNKKHFINILKNLAQQCNIGEEKDKYPKMTIYSSDDYTQKFDLDSDTGAILNIYYYDKNNRLIFSENVFKKL